MATAQFEIQASPAPTQFVDGGRRYVRFMVRFQAADATVGPVHQCDVQVPMAADAPEVRAEVRRVLEEQTRIFDRQVRTTLPALPSVPTAPVPVTVPDSYG